MNERFEAAVAFVLEHEGGFVDDPEDAGGVTNLGISLRFLKGVMPFATADAIRDMARETAVQIYRDHFWDTCRCYALPAGLDLAVFDCAVNQGPLAARRLLQRALAVEDDGYIGPITLKAVLDADPGEILTDFLVRRAKRYAMTGKAEIYGRGWFRRLFDVHRVSLPLIKQP